MKNTAEPIRERVQKIIAARGMCSRRKAEELIEQGRVKVNSKTIHLGDKASEKDIIAIDGKTVNRVEKKEYYALNKPASYLSSLSDPSGKRTITDLLRANNIRSRLIPVGRLDYSTEGLLLITNDGEFANKVMHPRYEVEKTYKAELDKPLKGFDKAKLEGGVEILGRKTWPAKINVQKGGKIVQLTIHEGRNKIVRRMFKKIGYEVNYLERISIGHLILGTLKRGKMRRLNKSELDLIFQKDKKVFKQS